MDQRAKLSEDLHTATGKSTSRLRRRRVEPFEECF
jgi:hypothetical protein